MRNRWILSMALVCALTVAGCSQSAQADAKINTVAACELTEREQTLISLVGSAQQDVVFLEYAAGRPYRAVTAWVEVYEDGVLAGTPLVLGLTGEERAESGLAAWTMSPELWTLAVSDSGGGRYTQSVAPAADLDGLAVAVIRPPEPAPFEIGDEIVMAARLYAKGDIAVPALSELTNPANLAGYDYALVLKGRFTLSDEPGQAPPYAEGSLPEEPSAPESASVPEAPSQSSALEEGTPSGVEEASLAAASSRGRLLKALADSVSYNKEKWELSLAIPEDLEINADSLYLHVSGRVRMGNGYRSWHAFEQETEKRSWVPGKTYTAYVEVWEIDYIEISMSFLPQQSAGEDNNDMIVVQVDNKGDLTMILPRSM